MELPLPGERQKAFERMAADADRILHAHAVRKLEGVTPPTEAVDRAPRAAGLPRPVDDVQGWAES